ncbi:hypothetical protein BOTBODRAFT_192124 [Botryobasidium botryosum FD-172 SS1]|uniref:C2H2-type domain-containing protein n=1 Tax=Botryobasidium botryosum (strain FD-172 SS1) TaxID=930990 RepID=A0A067LWY1_BOTB1|nr:hypothetical protein BOTBODRAFT_192124 [Botryobasidium botryosum FD-172 SS1]
MAPIASAIAKKSKALVAKSPAKRAAIAHPSQLTQVQANPDADEAPTALGEALQVCPWPDCVSQPFVRLSDFNRHYNKHTHEKLTWCPVEGCGHYGTQSSNVRYHYESVHLGLKTHHCDLCELPVSNFSSFVRHCNKAHPGINFWCPGSGCTLTSKVPKDIIDHYKRHHDGTADTTLRLPHGTTHLGYPKTELTSRLLAARTRAKRDQLRASSGIVRPCKKRAKPLRARTSDSDSSSANISPTTTTSSLPSPATPPVELSSDSFPGVTDPTVWNPPEQLDASFGDFNFSIPFLNGGLPAATHAQAPAHACSSGPYGEIYDPTNYTPPDVSRRGTIKPINDTTWVVSGGPLFPQPPQPLPQREYFASYSVHYHSLTDEQKRQWLEPPQNEMELIPESQPAPDFGSGVPFHATQSLSLMPAPNAGAQMDMDAPMGIEEANRVLNNVIQDFVKAGVVSEADAMGACAPLPTPGPALGRAPSMDWTQFLNFDAMGEEMTVA